MRRQDQMEWTFTIAIEWLLPCEVAANAMLPFFSHTRPNFSAASITPCAWFLERSLKNCCSIVSGRSREAEQYMWEPENPSAALVLQCRAVCIPCIGHGQTVDDSLCSGKRRHALLPGRRQVQYIEMRTTRCSRMACSCSQSRRNFGLPTMEWTSWPTKQPWRLKKAYWHMSSSSHCPVTSQLDNSNTYIVGQSGRLARHGLDPNRPGTIGPIT